MTGETMSRFVDFSEQSLVMEAANSKKSAGFTDRERGASAERQ